MEYKFQNYRLSPVYDPNGDLYRFHCVAISANEYETHLFENGWCHFIFEDYALECVTIVRVLFLNESPYTIVPISVLLEDCPEFRVFPPYNPSASPVGTCGNEEGEEK